MGTRAPVGSMSSLGSVLQVDNEELPRRVAREETQSYRERNKTNIWTYMETCEERESRRVEEGASSPL